MVALIIFLLCALGFFIYLTNKNVIEIEHLKEKVSPQTRKFVSVVFKENKTQLYEYFTGDIDLKIGDRVEVPFHNKSTGNNEVKIATVKYVSADGEQSSFARSYVIRKVEKSKSKAEKRFVQVIFNKDATKSYDYLIGNFEVKVGDFVVVHISDKNSGKVKLLNAQVVYISEPGETSEYAKSKIFKKATHNKW